MTPGDWVALAGDLLTVVVIVAAVIAIRYARQSAIASQDTVEPLERMATGIAATVTKLEAVQTSTLAAVDRLAGVEAALTGAQRDQRLLYRLGQYERVALAVERVRAGWVRVAVDHITDVDLKNALADLTGALSPIPAGELPDCRQALMTGPGWPTLSREILNARREVDDEIRLLLEYLDATHPDRLTDRQAGVSPE